MKKGNPPSNEKVGLTVRIEDKVFRKFKMALGSQRKTTQAVLEQAILDYIALHKKG